jgi:hypothetical protein
LLSVGAVAGLTAAAAAGWPHGSQQPTGSQHDWHVGVQQHELRQPQLFISRFMHRHAKAPSDVASKASAASVTISPRRRAMIEPSIPKRLEMRPHEKPQQTNTP